MKSPKSLSGSLVALGLVFAGQARAQVSQQYPFQIDCTIFGAVNSDTLRIRCGIASRALRLEAIDGPEPGQPWGDSTTAVIGSALANQPARVTVTGEDASGWRGSAMLAGGWDVGAQLVRMGLAWPAQGASGAQLASFMAEAKARKQGLWSDPAPMPPWNWRAAHPAQAATVPRTPVTITDENLERGDWSTFNRQGDKVGAGQRQRLEHDLARRTAEVLDLIKATENCLKLHRDRVEQLNCINRAEYRIKTRPAK